MDFAQKKAAYNGMLGAQHLDADLKLLRQKNPEAPALSTGIIDKEKAQSDILWDLLDVATIDEINKNREVKSGGEKEKGNPDDGAQKEKEKAEKKAAAEKALFSSNLAELPQKELAKIARGLQLHAPDFKADTLRPLLIEVKEKIAAEKKELNEPLPPADDTEKESEGTGEEMEETEGDLNSEEESTGDPEKKNQE